MDQNGQLGNRLTLVSHLLASAREHGHPLINLSFAKYAGGFHGLHPDRPRVWPHGGWFFPAFLQSPLRKGLANLARSGWIRGLGWNVQAEGVSCDLAGAGWREKLGCARHLVIWGYEYRSHPLVKKHREAIRGHLGPSAEARQAVQRWTERLAGSGARPAAALHMRRGEYRNFAGGRYFFSMEAYLAWGRQILSALGPREKLVVFGDEPEAVEQLRTSLGAEAGPGGLHADLFALASCPWVVAPPSSFSRWGAFQGGARLTELTDRHMVIRRESAEVPLSP